MTTAVKSKCPTRDSSPEFATVCDWLAANGIDEWLPEDPTFVVQDEHVKRIVYRGFQFDGDERGYDLDKISAGYVQVLHEDRSVPLLAPVTDAVRAAFDVLENSDPKHQAFLVETSNHVKMAAYRSRLGLPEMVSSVRYFNLDGEARTCLRITAQDGALHFKVGSPDVPEEEALAGAFTLSEKRIERLAADLPKLLESLKAERLRKN